MMDILLKYFSDFTPRQLAQYEALNALYHEWNEKINVISRKDIDSLYEKHVLHSLSIAASFEFADGTEILDLGTGGGFPGIPLAIFFPHLNFHLVDSIRKKLTIVEAVIEQTGLSNITIQHSRVEDLKNRKFDFVVSRAVAPLKDLWQWSKPLLKNKRIFPDAPFQNGLICLKGGDLHAEVQDSGTRPHIINIHELFSEPYFDEKYIVYIPK